MRSKGGGSVCGSKNDRRLGARFDVETVKIPFANQGTLSQVKWVGGGALYPEIDQSGSTANGMSSKQHQSISFHFCLIFLSDRELLDCSNCAIPTNCQGEAKFHLRSVKVSRIESSWERISRLYTSWRHLGADNGSDSFFVLFLEPETLQNWLQTSRFPKFLKREKWIWLFGC